MGYWRISPRNSGDPQPPLGIIRNMIRVLFRRQAAAAFVLLAVLTNPDFATAQSTDLPRVWPDEGPATWAPRPTAPDITADDLRTHVYQLAADSMRGRATATRENWMTAEYVAAEFRRLGLRPAGENGTYFQEVSFGQLSFDRDAIVLRSSEGSFDAGMEWAPVPAQRGLRLVGEISSQDMPVIFGGSWGDASAVLPSGVSGSAVVFRVPETYPGAAPGPLNPLRIRDLRAQEAGALLVILVSETLTENATEAAFTGQLGLLSAGSQGTASVHMTAAAAAQLFDAPLDVLSLGDLGKPISGSWQLRYERPQYPVRNIIAALRGSDPGLRGQYVLAGAHNDHVGMVQNGPLDHDALRAYNRVMRPQGANDRPGPPTPEQQARIDSLLAYARSIRPPRADSVMNGADDDASGTAVLLEIAERFATEPAPKRSIVFISHAAEEGGLLGSRFFTDNPTVPLDSIVAAHNMDMLGKGRVTDVRFGGPSQVQMLGARRLSAEFGDVIDSLNAVREETMAIDYSWDRTNALNRFCRSDQVNYFRHTIPVTYFSTGYSLDYHMASDEPQYVDYEHSARVGRFVHEIMSSVADRATRLRILPLEERDLSAQC